jgi:hypothetical protein
VLVLPLTSAEVAELSLADAITLMNDHWSKSDD